MDKKPGHPHGQQQPYKAELHPSPADESARALFSLPDSTHNTHTTHSHAGTDLYWLLIVAGCHPCGLVRGAALWNRAAPARYIQGASRSFVRLSSLSSPHFLIRADELESDIVRYGNPLKINQSMSVVFFVVCCDENKQIIQQYNLLSITGNTNDLGKDRKELQHVSQRVENIELVVLENPVRVPTKSWYSKWFSAYSCGRQYLKLVKAAAGLWNFEFLQK